MAVYSMSGNLFADMVRGGAVSLKNNVAIVNDLNVFPIPDGDTGDNMCRTITGGGNAAKENKTLGETAADISTGMLLSARGNSGVILSQFFEGVAKGFKGIDCADAAQFADAFKSGVKQAYSSVMTPTEGTILTVMREASEKASSCLKSDSSIDDYFVYFIPEMKESLKRTPDLLAVLKEAGVIDSGGAGFVYIIEGMNTVLKGGTVTDTSGAPAAAAPEAAPSGTIDFGPDTDMQFGYCTEVLVQLMNKKGDPEKFDVDALVSYLNSIGGNSIVAFRTGTIVKLHVHTMTPYKVLQYMQQFGEFITIKIENMHIQHTETTIENRYETGTPMAEEKKSPRVDTAIVAVAAGDGICAAFRELGASYIVDGQQTMNPSTEDFIKAFDTVNADTVYVLPNNPNIIMAAKQAAEIYKDSKIVVVETKTIAEGHAALAMFDPTIGDPDETKASLEEAIGSVTTGTVTYSIRDTQLEGVEIKKDDFIGIEGKHIRSCEKELDAAAVNLLKNIDKTDKSIIIMFRGKDSTESADNAVRNYIAESLPGFELYEIDGGQDVYSYIFAVE